MRTKKKIRIAAAILAGTMALHLAGCGAAPAKQTGHANPTSALTLVEGKGSVTNENGFQITAQPEDRTIVVEGRQAP